MKIKSYGGAGAILADMAVGPPSMVDLPPIDGTNVWGVALTFSCYIQTG